jgi:hypothetical protein
MIFVYRPVVLAQQFSLQFGDFSSSTQLTYPDSYFRRQNAASTRVRPSTIRLGGMDPVANRGRSAARPLLLTLSQTLNYQTCPGRRSDASVSGGLRFPLPIQVDPPRGHYHSHYVTLSQTLNYQSAQSCPVGVRVSPIAPAVLPPGGSRDKVRRPRPFLFLPGQLNLSRSGSPRLTVLRVARKWGQLPGRWKVHRQ